MAVHPARYECDRCGAMSTEPEDFVSMTFSVPKNSRWPNEQDRTVDHLCATCVRFLRASAATLPKVQEATK